MEEGDQGNDTLAESFRVAKLLDTERGARVTGFADSMARNAERRMMCLFRYAASFQ
jgi:hypothetical protein